MLVVPVVLVVLAAAAADTEISETGLFGRVLTAFPETA